MRIVETYSHLNGLEYLLVHKPRLWQEIQEVIQEVDGEELYNVIRQGRGVPAVPLVVVGIEV
ncbi:MAG: hypothetical protein OXE97_07895 [Gammaproteobacteria bacterium]|nr:hypothetical protein [Gammaproteobacteria bacterium]MCY4312904.1 hypothetical protein [Gammaproteobacteria bacterium]